MQRDFSTPVGIDLIGLSLPAQHIAGIRVDNPSGSWLKVSSAEAFVPPYTMGWLTSPTPVAATIDLRFVSAPSGIPSTLLGEPPTITLYDHAVGEDAGYPSGPDIVQHPGIGDIQRTYAVFQVPETPGTVSAAGLFPQIGFRLVLVRWRVIAMEITAYDRIKGPTEIWIRDTGSGQDLMPPALLTPEQPDSGFQPSNGFELAVNDGTDIGGRTGVGCGVTGVYAYIEYYMPLG